MSTIKDVAKLSGVSVGTVSRYLNGYQVKSGNKEKMDSAIKELNFTLNPIARGLKTSKTQTVGVIIPELSNMFSTFVIEGMEGIFEEFGYSVLVCNSRNDLKKEKEKLKFLKDKLVDGIIMMPVGDEGEHIEEVINSGLPVVLIDRLIKDLKCDAVVADNVNGVYQAVEAIIKKGHRSIGIIAGPRDVHTARERLEGYKRALMDYGIEINDDLIVYSDYNIEGGESAFKKILSLDNPPTAIFVSNYLMTTGALKSIIEEHLVIGEDISVFGYDQVEFFRILNPQLSVVVQPMDEIGLKAAELLVKRMSGDYSGYPMISRLKTDMIVTDSIKKIL
jgi:LacI family transcriptional regulator